MGEQLSPSLWGWADVLERMIGVTDRITDQEVTTFAQQHLSGENKEVFDDYGLEERRIMVYLYGLSEQEIQRILGTDRVAPGIHRVIGCLIALSMLTDDPRYVAYRELKTRSS
ncbi:MAG: hypothetical protein WCV84_00485 [Patescibacteria group bacterium]